MIHRYLSLSAVAVALLSCGQSNQSATSKSASQTSAMPSATRPAVLFFGTSLTAGYGIDPQQAYPALTQQKIDAAGLDYRVTNAGLSGGTPAGARRRAHWPVRPATSAPGLEYRTDAGRPA